MERGSGSRFYAGFWAVVLAAALFGPFSAAAGDFETANELFDQGKFAEAKSYLEKLTETGEGSANVFYNLGNTDYRLGANGRAMLNYERALALEPSHAEAAANLRLLREQSGAKLPARRWVESAVSRLPRSAHTWGTAVAGWMTIFGIVFLATRQSGAPGWRWMLTLVGLVGLAFFGAGIWLGFEQEKSGVVTARQAQARLAPVESAGVAEMLPAGSKVRVLQERGAWFYCALPGGGRGWLAAEEVERITPGSA